MVRTIGGNAEGRPWEGGLGNATRIPILHPDVITNQIGLPGHTPVIPDVVVSG
jgi:hypothetical protein